jgi:Cellulase (glycosyl hydrolase family 5)
MVSMLTNRNRLSGARGLVASALVAMLAVIALALAGASKASAAEAGVGINPTYPGQITEAKSLDVHWMRVFATWPDLEPQPGVFAQDWLNYYDKLFRSVPRGTKLIVDIVNSPRWETGSSDEHAPPANPADYAAFIGALAHRWAGHVAAYEIWNEEDAPIWWTGAPNPAAYAQLLKAAYPAVKAADPSATVVLGGLTGNDYSFLQGVYQAGGKGSFDAVGVHTDTACNVLSPYSFLRGSDNRMITDSFLAYREVHATELANGDRSPIWMTEFSWATTNAVCSAGVFAGQKQQGVSERSQAAYLRQAFHCLKQDPYVKVALWFTMQDEGGTVSGLARGDGSHKPSYTAMREFVHKGDRLKESCGVFTGPKITVASPANHIRYSGPLPIHVFARSRNDVFRVRLEIDGKLIRNYDNRSPSHTIAGLLTWQGAKHISLGKHTLTVLAYDKERNVSKRTLVIVHKAPARHHKHRLSHY